MFKFWLEGLILWKAFSIEMMGKKYFQPISMAQTFNIGVAWTRLARYVR